MQTHHVLGQTLCPGIVDQQNELRAVFVNFYFVLVCFDIFCLIGLFPICFFFGGGLALVLFLVSIFNKGSRENKLGWAGNWDKF